MGLLGIVFFPVGVFLVLAGIVLVTDSPFMKGMLDQVEFLKKNDRLTGSAMVIIGFILMALS